MPRIGDSEPPAFMVSGGVAVIRVGAATEIEMKEKKARVEDALHATRPAVEEGIVPGGGVALLRARKALDGLKGANTDQDAGLNIVRRALGAVAHDRHDKLPLPSATLFVMLNRFAVLAHNETPPSNRPQRCA
jgi:hypothetical protein